MGRHSLSFLGSCESIKPELFDYVRPEPRLGRSAETLEGWRVVDDWPDRVPVTEREVDVFEAWFGDILDELFGPA